MTPLITTLNNRKSVVSFTHRPDYPEKKGPQYEPNRRLCGSQTASGRFGGDNIL